MRKLAILLVFVLGLTAGVAAIASARWHHSGDPVLLGNTNAVSQRDSSAPDTEAFGYTATTSGTATSVSAYLDSTSGGKLGLYSDSSSKPHALLDSATAASNSSGWVTLSLTKGVQITSGTRYWIAIAPNGSHTPDYRDTSGGGSLDYTGSGGLPATFTTDHQWSSNPASAYVSGTTAPPPPVKPANTAIPTISGTAQQGDTLTATSGTWTGTAPIGYTYLWSDGATGSTDTLGAGDVGQNVSVTVTASNTAGSAQATSASVGPVTSNTPPPPVAPSNTAPPIIAGTAQQGDTLTVSNGTWSGDTPMTFTYAWSDGTTGSSDTLSAADVGQTITATVTATNDGGNASATSAAVGPVTASSGGLPPGVTLQQIDGGPNYYCGRGFTYACNAGYDNPAFFPIFDDYAFYPSHSVATFKALGLTSDVRVTGDTDMSLLRNNGITAVLDGLNTNFGSETVGWHIEEPDGWSGTTYSVLNQANAFAGNLTGRFLQVSFTSNQFIYGFYGGGCNDADMASVMSCTSGMPSGRHLDMASADIYWFAGAHDQYLPSTCGKFYGLSGDCTSAQTMQGTHYGDMVDEMRQWTNGTAPTAPYVETGDALVGSGGQDITPPELNWAVWSSLIHGARQILYFGTTSDEGCAATFGFCTNVLPGQTISDYTQAAATDAQVTNLAPVLNSPFADGYVTASPAAYNFPTPDITLNTGIDAMAKDDNGTFYVFATPRGSESQSNVQATFTTADNYTGAVTVVGENRSIQATNGVFADTFAHGSTVHIYQIP